MNHEKQTKERQKAQTKVHISTVKNLLDRYLLNNTVSFDYESFSHSLRFG